MENKALQKLCIFVGKKKTLTSKHFSNSFSNLLTLIDCLNGFLVKWLK